LCFIGLIASLWLALVPVAFMHARPARVVLVATYLAAYGLAALIAHEIQRLPSGSPWMSVPGVRLMQRAGLPGAAGQSIPLMAGLMAFGLAVVGDL
jgi:hypothetical protein